MNILKVRKRQKTCWQISKEPWSVVQTKTKIVKKKRQRMKLKKKKFIFSILKSEQPILAAMCVCVCMCADINQSSLFHHYSCIDVFFSETNSFHSWCEYIFFSYIYPYLKYLMTKVFFFFLENFFSLCLIFSRKWSVSFIIYPVFCGFFFVFTILTNHYYTTTVTILHNKVIIVIIDK